LLFLSAEFVAGESQCSIDEAADGGRLQFVEHVEFFPGQVAVGFDSGEELVEAADLVRREQEHPLVLQGAACADGTSRAGARAVELTTLI
jgi:hypothetical protein